MIFLIENKFDYIIHACACIATSQPKARKDCHSNHNQVLHHGLANLKRRSPIVISSNGFTLTGYNGSGFYNGHNWFGLKRAQPFKSWV
jgi:hypothetical protein